MKIHTPFALAALLLLSACGGGDPAKEDDPAKEIAGRWESPSTCLALLEDGRVRLQRGAEFGEGRYELAEPKRLRLAYDSASARTRPGEYAVELAGEDLSLCRADDPEDCLILKRARSRGAASRKAGEGASAGEGLAAVDPDTVCLGAEATGVLKLFQRLQETYRADHGAYAATRDELARTGWEDPPLRHYELPEMTLAEGGFCATMRPKSPRLRPVSIDQRGELHDGPGCG